MNNFKESRIVVIAGPTASGKSALAIEIAKDFQSEIICADSQTVYRYLDIGTAKPSLEDQKRVPHHLLNVVDPKEQFDVVKWQQLAQKKIEVLWQQKKIPVLVGGTALYLDSIVEGYDLSVESFSLSFRKKLDNLKLVDLQRRLEQVDLEAYEGIDLTNRRRVQRALEYFFLTGHSIVKQKQRRSKVFDLKPEQVLQICVDIPRQVLYERINSRVDEMVGRGLLREVEWLVASYGMDLPSFQAIGYRHILAYLQGEVRWGRAVELIKRDSRRYAKRQLTWWRRKKNVLWVEPGRVRRVVSSWLQIEK